MAAVVSVLVVAAVSVAAIEAGEPQNRRDQQVFAEVHHLNEVAADAVEGSRIVYIVVEGVGATLSLAPAVTQALVGDGYDVRVDANQEEGYRSHMVLQPGEVPDVVLLVQSASERDELSTAGEALAVSGLNDEYDELLKQIKAAIAEGGVVRSADFDRKVEDLFGDAPETAAFVDQVVEMLEGGDVRLVSSPVIGDLLASGALTIPEIDAALAEATSRLKVQSIWGDRYIGLRLLTAAEAGLDSPTVD